MSENRFLDKHFIMLWMLIASIADDRGGISFASNHLVFKNSDILEVELNEWIDTHFIIVC